MNPSRMKQMEKPIRRITDLIVSLITIIGTVYQNDQSRVKNLNSLMDNDISFIFFSG
jgi:hypothetical protein